MRGRTGSDASGSPRVAGHPAVWFGAWLKAKRRERRIVARLFAGQVGLSAAKYAEVEAGVISWLNQGHERALPGALALSDEDAAVFRALLDAAKGAPTLRFTDVFTREQLEPCRPMPPEVKETILDCVFAPLR